jgi:ectoine hydroxylase-related dioxygenase (phytanoyl-CoA dioxygenase family)
MNFERHLEELEEQRYTLLPGLIDRRVTAEIRAFIDRTIRDGHQKQPERGSSEFHHRICHPIEDPIAARLASDPVLLDLAAQSLRADNLRLRQQMFMITYPCGKPAPATPDGFHTDTVFLPEEWHDTPRKTFVQLFYYCNPIRPGGAATMVIPGSHRLTLEAVRKADPKTEEERWAVGRELVRLSGADLSQAVELTCEEGDVALFSPMLLHSGSNNVTDQPRYAFHCSFHDASARRIRRLPAPTFYDTFPESMIAAMPPERLPLLER